MGPYFGGPYKSRGNFTCRFIGHEKTIENFEPENMIKITLTENNLTVVLKMTDTGRDQRLVGSNKNLNWASGSGNKEKGMDERDWGSKSYKTVSWFKEHRRDGEISHCGFKLG